MVKLSFAVPASRIDRRRYTLVIVITVAALCCAQACVSLPFGARLAADDAVIVEYDVRAGGDLVTLPVAIQGKLYPFAVGTSNAQWMFDESLRDMLKPIDSRVAVAADGRKLFEVPATSIGPFSVGSDSRGVCIAFRDRFGRIGEDVHGLVGLPFLQDKILTIDFDRGKVRFLRWASPDCGQPFNIELIDTPKGILPFLTVNLPNGPERFHITTSVAGFSAGTIAHKKFAQLLKRGALTLVADEKNHGEWIGHERTRSARLAEFVLGNFRHKRLLMDDSDISSLDLGYWSRYIVTFDFRHRLLYLRPGRNYHRVGYEITSGLACACFEGEVFVLRVLKDRPAAEAGLMFMDQIVTVDGESAAPQTYFETCRKFTLPGRHDVIFNRDGEQMRTTVVIEDDLTAPDKGDSHGDTPD